MSQSDLSGFISPVFILPSIPYFTRLPPLKAFPVVFRTFSFSILVYLVRNMQLVESISWNNSGQNTKLSKRTIRKHVSREKRVGVRYDQ